MTAATGHIALATAGYYVNETDWRAKTGISINDESSAQFDTDLEEARELFRHNCFHLVRERIIFKRSDDKCYLPVRWIADGNLDGSVTTSDFYIYQLDSDGFAYDAVDAVTYVDSIDAFNNYITFDSSFEPTNQLYITYYACSKPYDEVVEEVKRAIFAQLTILVIERLRLRWGLKGTTGWSVPGVTVSKDVNAYKELYAEAQQELGKYKSYLRPFIGRRLRMGLGSPPFDPGIAYSSQVQPYVRIRRGWSI